MPVETFVLIAAIIGAVGAILASLISARAYSKIRETHLMINSRMDELLKLTTENAHAAGMAQQREMDNGK